MTVKELIDKLELKILVEDDLDREIKDCYIGDLLSWVMGNINSIAVATLADVSCIILVENAALDDNARQKAEMHGVNILTTEENAYQLAVKISKLLEG